MNPKDFKIGQTVKRTGDEYNGMVIGDIDVITDVGNNIELKKFGPGHSKRSLSVINFSWKGRYEVKNEIQSWG